jgi:hypothetical protein
MIGARSLILSFVSLKRLIENYLILYLIYNSHWDLKKAINQIFMIHYIEIFL